MAGSPDTPRPLSHTPGEGLDGAVYFLLELLQVYEDDWSAMPRDELRQRLTWVAYKADLKPTQDGEVLRYVESKPESLVDKEKAVFLSQYHRIVSSGRTPEPAVIALALGWSVTKALRFVIELDAEGKL